MTGDARVDLQDAGGTLTREFVGLLFADAEGKQCPYCGMCMDRRTKSLDHMIPITKRGLHSAFSVRRSNESEHGDRSRVDNFGWCAKRDPTNQIVALPGQEGVKNSPKIPAKKCATATSTLRTTRRCCCSVWCEALAISPTTRTERKDWYELRIVAPSADLPLGYY